MTVSHCAPRASRLAAAGLLLANAAPAFAQQHNAPHHAGAAAPPAHHQQPAQQPAHHQQQPQMHQQQPAMHQQQPQFQQPQMHQQQPQVHHQQPQFQQPQTHQQPQMRQQPQIQPQVHHQQPQMRQQPQIQPQVHHQQPAQQPQVHPQQVHQQPRPLPGNQGQVGQVHANRVPSQPAHNGHPVNTLPGQPAHNSPAVTNHVPNQLPTHHTPPVHNSPVVHNGTPTHNGSPSPTGRPTNALPVKPHNGGPVVHNGTPTQNGRPTNTLPVKPHNGVVANTTHPGGNAGVKNGPRPHVVLKPTNPQTGTKPAVVHNRPSGDRVKGQSTSKTMVDHRNGSVKKDQKAGTATALTQPSRGTPRVGPSRPVLGKETAAKIAGRNQVKPGPGGLNPNRVTALAANPGKSLSLFGDQSGQASANVLKGEMIGTMKAPSGLSPLGKTDLGTLRNDVQNGATAEQVQADVDRLKQDIAAQESTTGKPVPGADALIQKADQLATLSNLSDQLAQGPPTDDLPLPTGEATFISNPTLPEGQMVVLNPNTVLVGGGGYVPQTATMLPIGGGGSNMAVWTGTMADMGVPVQAGMPLADVAPVYVPTGMTSAVTPGMPLAAVDAASGIPGGAGVAPPPPPIRVVMVNPAETGGPITYAVASESYTLEPGYEQEHEVAAGPVIEFDRGGEFGTARYTLQPARYAFAVGEKGWDIATKAYEATLDNSDNPNDFHYLRGEVPEVVPARQVKPITDRTLIRVAFNRGGDAEPAVKELGDGLYKIGVDARTGLLDLFLGDGGAEAAPSDAPADADRVSSTRP
jgi:hypothetical protein